MKSECFPVHTLVSSNLWILILKTGRAIIKKTIMKEEGDAKGKLVVQGWSYSGLFQIIEQEVDFLMTNGMESH